MPYALHTFTITSNDVPTTELQYDDTYRKERPKTIINFTTIMSEGNKDTLSSNQGHGDNNEGRISESAHAGEYNPAKISSSSKVDENNESSSTDSSGNSGSGRGYNADSSASDDQLSDDFSNNPKRQRNKVCNDNGDAGASSRIRYFDKTNLLRRNHDDCNDSDYGHFRNNQNDNTNVYHDTNVSHGKLLDEKYDVNALSQLWCNAASAAVAAHYNEVSATVTGIEQLHVGCNLEKVENLHQASAAGSLLPQWNGIHISNPLDPRIDFNSLCQIQSSSSSSQGIQDVQSQRESTLDVDNTTGIHNHTKDLQHSPELPASSFTDPLLIVDSYMRLMEAVRPYFNAHGVALVQPQQSAPLGVQQLVPTDSIGHQRLDDNISGEAVEAKGLQGDSTSTDPNLSSEGFTSFFTTTDSNSSRNGTSEVSFEKGTDTVESNLVTESKFPVPAQGDKSDCGSSMVVLARPKKKRIEDPPDSSSEELSSNTTNSSERRVRIQEAAHNRLQLEQEQRQHNVQQQQILLENHALELQERQHEAQHIIHMNEFDERRNPPTRLVTDVSSSNRTDSAVSNTTSSGSGSAGNTGSGSNQGSSGSGNDGKNSSEEQAKEDNSGGDGTNEGSDGSMNDRKHSAHKLGIGLAPGGQHKLGIGLAPGGQHHRHTNGTHDSELRSPVAAQAEASILQLQPVDKGSSLVDTHVTRDRKILDKKRKRIEMRREYEAQQHMDFSESSDAADKFFRPGRPVTLDQVMVFCVVPRIVLQSVPPFLIIHTNAAFCRLTGIDSHIVVGKPIGYMLSLPPKSQSTDELGPGTNNAMVRSNIPSDVGLERLVAASGFGHYQILNVRSKQQQLLGRNVSFLSTVQSSVAAVRKRDDSSSAPPNAAAEYSHLTCRAAIAPIVSTNTYCTFDRNKALPTADFLSNKRNNQVPLVTHYVIQIQPVEEETVGMAESVGSLSMHSNVEQAYLMGLSRADVQRQRVAAGLHFNERPAIGFQSLSEEGSTADSSTTKVPVTAVA